MVVTAKCCGDLAHLKGPGNLSKLGWMEPNILEQNLKRSAKTLKMSQKFIFQQVNDPELKLPGVACKNEVDDLEWPIQSLDLNPTENLWNDLKVAVSLRKPTNLSQLEQFCKEEWGKISKCAKLCRVTLKDWSLWLGFYQVLTQRGEYCIQMIYCILGVRAKQLPL